VPLCPADPPRNGELSDQGEAVGRIGATSSTFTEIATGKDLYCLAVTKAERAPNGLIVTVLLVNRAGRPFDLEGENGPDLPVLTYGADGVEAARVGSFAEGERGHSYFAGVVPPGGRRTGEFAFEVPAGRQAVVVSMLGFAWRGTVG
jgi:hypothetical protein